ncbi:MAG TPA: cytochrome c oxidase subunit 3 [Terriglobia bacterium]|nr:cytochrome c oxidase subunit 3 [Terriglobia bacterium]
MGTATLTPSKPGSPGDSAPPPGKGNDGRGGGGSGGSGGQGHRGPSNPPLPPGAYRIAIWIVIVAITMFFLALTSALVVRSGISNDWVHTAIPPILYFNTLVLICSSVTLELSRRSLKREAGEKFARWLYVTTALGITFILGQLAAWRELAAQGIYIATNPSSSFLYMLTAAHGLHLLGGILGLLYLVFRRRQILAIPRKRIALDVTAIYWHFMDGLWIYLLILLIVKV